LECLMSINLNMAKSTLGEMVRCITVGLFVWASRMLPSLVADK